jgi:hypothetical protein
VDLDVRHPIGHGRGAEIADGERRRPDEHELSLELLRIRRAFFEVLRTKLKWGQR